MVDHEAGRVTVITVDDDAELKTARLKIGVVVRERGYWLRSVVKREDGKITLYVKVQRNHRWELLRRHER